MFEKSKKSIGIENFEKLVEDDIVAKKKRKNPSKSKSPELVSKETKETYTIPVKEKKFSGEDLTWI